MSRYKEYFKFNKNILISFAASITISAIFAEYVFPKDQILNSTFTLIIDYIIYFSTFGGLFYLDNRKKYYSSNVLNKSLLKHDLIKILSSLGVSEIIYTIIRWFFHYYFISGGDDPYQASIISQLIATGVYMITINASIRLTRLYK